MTATTVLMKGKYSGMTFEDILHKDINYCSFIMGMKFVSKDLQDFKNWLDITFDVAYELHVKRELDRVAQRHLKSLN